MATGSAWSRESRSAQRSPVQKLPRVKFVQARGIGLARWAGRLPCSLPDGLKSAFLSRTYGWTTHTIRPIPQLVQKGPATDVAGRPVSTATNASNPWWLTFEKAIASAGGELSKPEILSSTTDSRFARQLGIPALGFSPMTSTPILLHDHNEFLEDRVFLRGIQVFETTLKDRLTTIQSHQRPPPPRPRRLMMMIHLQLQPVALDQVILCCPHGPLMNLLRLTVAYFPIPVCVGSTDEQDMKAALFQKQSFGDVHGAFA
ncbi:Peptidase M20/M25/M40 family protein [Zea mays]|uniref:Peptidase M20/M25/M40 family protein n=1 Tax=Zea mays TaxID=4577 RepID=A0A1D6IIA2_MAIZE|nr:Peptidase M20/M25/M40 family protein [Zea mays]